MLFLKANIGRTNDTTSSVHAHYIHITFETLDMEQLVLVLLGLPCIY